MGTLRYLQGTSLLRGPPLARRPAVPFEVVDVEVFHQRGPIQCRSGPDVARISIVLFEVKFHAFFFLVLNKGEGVEIFNSFLELGEMRSN